jgi:phosphoglycolate phosphatase
MPRASWSWLRGDDVVEGRDGGGFVEAGAIHFGCDGVAREELCRDVGRAVVEQVGDGDPKRQQRLRDCYPPLCSNMPPTCSVLLDLDGTLIDSQPGIVASCLAALRALGHKPDEALDVKRFIGPPLEDTMQILLQAFGDDRVAEAVVAYRQHYGESGLLGSEPYPGIVSALREMRKAGLRLCLATSKREAFARRILQHLELTTYFNGIYGSVPDGNLDHKPELLAHILSEQNILASHSLMVGDRRHDIIGAHAVNMRSLGVLWGYGSRDELEAAGADQLVESTANLARIVSSMFN